MGIPERKLTEVGIENHFSANYLGFLLLFRFLKRTSGVLLASATPGFSSRTVVVSPSAHRAEHLPASNDYKFEGSEYNHEAAYNNSKLAAVYLANRIEHLFGSQGLHATSLHPGATNTDISRNLPKEALNAIMTNPSVRKILKSPTQGAATTVWAAVSKQWENKSGKYICIWMSRKRTVARMMVRPLVLDGSSKPMILRRRVVSGGTLSSLFKCWVAKASRDKICR